MFFSVMVPGRAAVKKNTQRVVGVGRRKRVIYSPLYLAWAQVARIACMRAHHGQSTYDGLIEAHFNFTFKNHQSESDLSNCLEGIQDILQTTGVIKDDKQIRCIVAKKHFGGDPCTTVHLFPYEASHV